jgi:NADH-quinone oxidoreductase subunit C
MDTQTLLAAVQAAVPGARIDTAPSVDLHMTIYVTRDALPAVARALRDQAGLRFELLAEVTAIDFWPKQPRYEVVYVLVSFEQNARLRVKVQLDGEDAHVQTVSDVWRAANWLEREVWDMFGIVFDGHPDPRRLLMPEDWEGFPLRKDYPVQIRMKPRTAEALQVTEQEFRANLEKDQLARRG